MLYYTFILYIEDLIIAFNTIGIIIYVYNYIKVKNMNKNSKIELYK